MKVIDLLNKIANNEEVPRVRYDDIEAYIGADGYLKDNYGDNVEWWIDKEWLNTEIEIIEEKPKKIEELDDLLTLNLPTTNEVRLLEAKQKMRFKINELTKAVNYLLEKESDK